jgi:hypothetical protein
MSWLFSQALVEEYLGENFSDGEPSAPSNGSPTQQAYCAPDKMTGFCRLSRFGMTFRPLTADHGEELLTLFLAAFHVKTSVPQEKATDLTDRDQECGDTWRGWLAKYDPVTSSWKTAQCSLLGEESELLETLPRWGMTVDGLLWELPMLERRISGTGFGCVPNGQTFFHTPNTNGLDGGSNSRRALQKRQWSTPTAHNAKEGGFPSEHNRNTPTLSAQAGGSLNPTWVEWLMGWPLGWTDLKPLATDKSPSAPQPHGECSEGQ